jgi:DnaJ-class molecular chaperone
MIDHYAALGVAVSATSEEIGKAFRKATLECHPDRNKTDIAKARFIAIQSAHQILSDPESRAAYDRARELAALIREEDSLDISHSEQTLQSDSPFAPAGSSAPQHSAKQQLDIFDEIDINLAELFNGSVRWFEVKRKIRCPELTCGNSCLTCRGKRWVERRKKLKIDISAWHEPPPEFRFPGDGDEAVDGRQPPGDVIIRSKIVPHFLYRREGVNLFYEKQISTQEILTGFEFDLPPLDRRDWRFSLFDQVVDFSGHYVARGYGMMTGPAGQRGHLIISFSMRLPRRLISEKEDWLAAWRDINRDSEENPTHPLALLSPIEYYHLIK